LKLKRDKSRINSGMMKILTFKATIILKSSPQMSTMNWPSAVSAWVFF
jgi:hypothetical protein